MTQRQEVMEVHMQLNGVDTWVAGFAVGGLILYLMMQGLLRIELHVLQARWRRRRDCGGTETPTLRRRGTSRRKDLQQRNR